MIVQDIRLLYAEWTNSYPVSYCALFQVFERVLQHRKDAHHVNVRDASRQESLAVASVRAGYLNTAMRTLSLYEYIVFITWYHFPCCLVQEAPACSSISITFTVLYLVS